MPNVFGIVLGGNVRQFSGSTTYDPPSLADGASTSTTLTVTGAAVGDFALAAHDKILTNAVMVSAHVSAADTVTVILLNRTGGVLDLASGTLSAFVWRVS